MDERQLLDTFVESELITEENALSLSQMQKQTGRRFLQLATETGMFSEEELISHIATIMALPLIDLDSIEFDRSAWSEGEEFFVTSQIVPLKKTDKTLTLAVFDPTDTMLFRTLRLGHGLDIELYLVPQKQIIAFWDVLLDNDANPEVDNVEHMIDIASEAPVVRVVNDIISRAVELNGSDIHLERLQNQLNLRYRLDGILQEMTAPPGDMAAAIISRIKILANLDIAERRLPQDGSMRFHTSSKTVDLRVSIIPSVRGESVVLRILDTQSVMLDFDSLGIVGVVRENIDHILTKSTGMLVVAGPTGAGKTTTLYAALNSIMSTERKIITIEDPVEYKIQEITQIQVNNKAGMTFASGLRSILRHDPDVILVGEIRDTETAAISVQAAMTGHLVLSTLHANRTSQVFGRLIDMDVDSFLVSASVTGALSQRLVRRLCPACREPYTPSLAIRERFSLAGDAVLYHAVGCDLCHNSGFKGRLGLYEVISINEEIQRCILNNATGREVEQAAGKDGFSSMFDDGILKALAGETSIEDIIRVID